MYNLHFGIKSPKYEGYFRNFRLTAQSKQAPIGCKIRAIWSPWRAPTLMCGYLLILKDGKKCFLILCHRFLSLYVKPNGLIMYVCRDVYVCFYKDIFVYIKKKRIFQRALSIFQNVAEMAPKRSWTKWKFALNAQVSFLSQKCHQGTEIEPWTISLDCCRQKSKSL
jgi:hypothetical protein